MANQDPTIEFVNFRDLIENCYSELKRRAGHKMRRERIGHSWTETVLVHELVEKLLNGNAEVPLKKDDFFRVAYTAMSRILTDHRRKLATIKRSRDKRVALSVEQFEEKISPKKWTQEEWLDFESFCDEKSVDNPRAIKALRMRIMFGYTNPEVAQCLGISPQSARADFNRMKTCLAKYLGLDDEGTSV